MNEKDFNMYLPLHGCTSKQKNNVKNKFSINFMQAVFSWSMLECINLTKKKIVLRWKCRYCQYRGMQFYIL